MQVIQLSARQAHCFAPSSHSTLDTRILHFKAPGTVLGFLPDFSVLLSVYIVDLRVERGCLWGVLEDLYIFKKLLCH